MVGIRLGSRRLWVGLTAVAALTIGASVAFGAIPDSGGVIHACYKSNGDLRLIDTAAGNDGTCKSQETALAWNQQGPAGAQGPAGPAGPPGLPGRRATRAARREGRHRALRARSGPLGLRGRQERRATRASPGRPGRRAARPRTDRPGRRDRPGPAGADTAEHDADRHAARDVPPHVVNPGGLRDRHLPGRDDRRLGRLLHLNLDPNAPPGALISLAAAAQPAWQVFFYNPGSVTSRRRRSRTAPRPRRREATRRAATLARRVALLRLPQPFDFELSTERFRAFGPDLANLWHEGGLHRVVAGRELRIEPARRRRRRRAARRRDRAGRRASCSAPSSTSTAFYAWVEAGPTPSSTRLVGRAPRLPAAARARPVRDARDLDHGAAGLALRRVRDPQPPDRALRRARRATPTPSRPRPRSPTRREDEIVAHRLLAAQGRVRARARPRRTSTASGSRRCPTRRSTPSSTAIRGIGEWTADWFLARHLARPRAWPAGDLGLRKAVEAFYADGATLTTPEVRAMGARFDPFQNLTAHYLLTGLARWRAHDDPRRATRPTARGALPPPSSTRLWARPWRAEQPAGRLVRRQDRARRRGRRRARRAGSSRPCMPPDIGHVHLVYVAPRARRAGRDEGAARASSTQRLRAAGART